MKKTEKKPSRRTKEEKALRRSTEGVVWRTMEEYQALSRRMIKESGLPKR